MAFVSSWFRPLKGCGKLIGKIGSRNGITVRDNKKETWFFPSQGYVIEHQLNGTTNRLAFDEYGKRTLIIIVLKVEKGAF